MGPSGSGKSHADALRRRARPPHVGRGVHRRHRPRRRSTRTELTLLRRDRIGFIFQAYNLIPTLDAPTRTSLLPLTLAGRKPDQEWFDHVVETVGLAGPPEAPAQPSSRAASSSASRSPGRSCRRPDDHLRRRAHRQPRLAAPAPRSSRSCASAVDELGQTIVMVTHDPRAASYADRVALPRRRPDRRRDARTDRRPGARPDEAVRGLSAMLNLVLSSVRHNAGRYLATLVAIITGVGFYAATGFLSDRVIDTLEGDVDRQYGNVDVAVVLDTDSQERRPVDRGAADLAAARRRDPGARRGGGRCRDADRPGRRSSATTGNRSPRTAPAACGSTTGAEPARRLRPAHAADAPRARSRSTAASPRSEGFDGR